MKRLGHTSPEMSILYAKFPQNDLQRGFRAVRAQLRHLVPQFKTTIIPVTADLPGALHHVEALNISARCSGVRFPNQAHMP